MAPLAHLARRLCSWKDPQFPSCSGSSRASEPQWQMYGPWCQRQLPEDNGLELSLKHRRIAWLGGRRTSATLRDPLFHSHCRNLSVPDTLQCKSVGYFEAVATSWKPDARRMPPCLSFKIKNSSTAIPALQSKCDFDGSSFPASGPTRGRTFEPLSHPSLASKFCHEDVPGGRKNIFMA